MIAHSDGTRGIVRFTRGGYAFLIRDDGGDDLAIAEDGLGGAIHGDRVTVSIVEVAHDFRAMAVVDEILERTRPRFTGELIRQSKVCFVRPDSPFLPERLPLQLGSQKPVGGSKILFRVENTGRKNNAPIAVFEEMLGDADDPRLDHFTINAEFGITTRFTDAAMDVAVAAVASPDPEEDERREDFRDQRVVTIDPVDAKDFDDAIALERVPTGGYLLTVHIADVTAYVAEGSVLDLEAAQRGTSVYYPGVAIPMLPEEISSGAASLSPDQDKRTMAIEMRCNESGQIDDVRLVRGWIRSSRRFHYEQAQAILSETETSGDEAVDRMLFRMLELATRLREERFRHGGFELDVPEAEMKLGPDGIPSTLRRRSRIPSHWVIEEFMIAANRAVGAWAKAREVPFLYRVHEDPNWKSLEQFADVARTMLPSTSEKVFQDLPSLRKWISALPEGMVSRVVQRYFLRSMKKAVYDPKDLGHFGLGIRAYCHFTSPIRRYPDLFNHRRIKELLDNRGPSKTGRDPDTVALVSTRREVNAEEAEREMIRLKSMRYLSQRLGQEANGHVVGMTRRGLFVELEKVPIDGFVLGAGLSDRAVFMEDRFAWVDERSGWELRPGDRVRVQIVSVDLRQRSADFRLTETPRGGLRPGRRRARGANEEARPKKGRASGGRRGGPKGRRDRPDDRSGAGRASGTSGRSGSSSRRGKGARRLEGGPSASRPSRPGKRRRR